MSLLKSNKVDKPYLSKETLECETKGSEQEESYEEETKEEKAEPVEKKRNNLAHGGSSSKKRKRNEGDYEKEIETDQESVEEQGKKSKGKNIFKGTTGRRISTRNNKK